MFHTHEAAVSLAILLVPLCAFGSWPSLRQRCDAPVAAFALLNVSAQFFTVAIFGLTVGSSLVGSHESALSALGAALSGFNARTAAIMLGGFLLGEEASMKSKIDHNSPARTAAAQATATT